MPEAESREGIEAEYVLETPATCPTCRAEISTLQVIRMLRGRVNFTSTLPRRGVALICPACGVLVSAELGTL